MPEIVSNTRKTTNTLKYVQFQSGSIKGERHSSAASAKAFTDSENKSDNETDYTVYKYILLSCQIVQYTTIPEFVSSSLASSQFRPNVLDFNRLASRIDYFRCIFEQNFAHLQRQRASFAASASRAVRSRAVTVSGRRRLRAGWRGRVSCRLGSRQFGDSRSAGYTCSLCSLTASSGFHMFVGRRQLLSRSICD